MTFKHPPRPSAHSLFETQRVWKGCYQVQRVTETCDECGHKRRRVYRRPKSPGEWVCKHCGADTQTKYIATGHDHTDYSYDVCGCAGAAKHGRPYHLLT